MFQRSYPVLLVDDDPDVLSVSKLALRGIKVFGVPLDIHVATSKAAAIELLAKRTSKLPTGREVAPFAVALIDVVMETNTAGLELCAHLRDTMKNGITQIYVRTGQAGLAPERAVIDKYDINGYFTKVEMTEQKLYTIVKAGVRQVHNAIRNDVIWTVIDALIVYGQSREAMSQVLNHAIGSLKAGVDGKPVNDAEPRVALILDGKVAANGMDLDNAALLGRSNELAAMTGKPFGNDGDRYVVDGNHFQVTVAPSASTVEGRFIATTTGEVQDFMVEPYYRLIHASAALWKNAAK
jgi:CheY-like chemotaxis protein